VTSIEKLRIHSNSTLHKTITERVWRGDAVWVEIADGGARHGAIGLLSPHKFNPQEPQTYPAMSRAEAVYGAEKFDIHFPKKKPLPFRVRSKTVFFLSGYTGPAVFNFKTEKREKKEKVIPLDITGHPIAVNNMVVFTTAKLGCLQYGTVKRISESGNTVFIKKIDIQNAQYVEGSRWNKDTVPVASSVSTSDNRNDRVTVIRSDLLTDLMRVKLAL
jgi:hypothetical protein